MSDIPIVYEHKLNQSLLDNLSKDASLEELKAHLHQATEALYAAFDDGTKITLLLQIRSRTIDIVLQTLWEQIITDVSTATLVAVGGYGRQEMHPASDIDLLILLKDTPTDAEINQLSEFLTRLWDIGLEVGHSIRTLQECVDEAEADLTVITNLIESRYLSGSAQGYQALQVAIKPENIWPANAFFKAKLEELNERYKKFGDTAYRVEPNLKEGPGGLRDIQTIRWIILRYFGTLSITELQHHNLLTHKEYKCLLRDQELLWRIRFLLHRITGKKEDRLMFHYQQELAKAFSKANEPSNKQIEHFMQRYYQAITRLRSLTELLKNLLIAKFLDEYPGQVIPVDHHFELINNHLRLKSADLFEKKPELLLEIFLVLQSTPDTQTISPSTARLIRQNLHLIDRDEYRQNPICQAIFIRILKQPEGITNALRKMNTYGVLSAYIPAFKGIVGLMQFDLYHAYTVDEHTLHLLRNLRRNMTDKGAKELPLCHRIQTQLEKPELLYLAGLFHDIAKGRNGDHSVLGAVDAYDFCRSHQLSRKDATLVSWLVQQHLLISGFIQKKDINDIDVIAEFANYVVDSERLDYLYLLTIADIRATNMKLWTEWKHTLMKQLYFSTKHYLESEASALRSTEQINSQKLEFAYQELDKANIPENTYKTFWEQFDKNYFTQNTAHSIAWHATEILSNRHEPSDNELPIICLRQNTSNNGTMVFVYAKDTLGLFTKIAMTLEQGNYNTLQAKASTTRNGKALYTFMLLDQLNQPISNIMDQQRLLDRLQENIAKPLVLKKANYPSTKRLEQFNVPTEITFEQDNKMQKTIMEVKTKDAPGILSKISQVIYKENLFIHDAWINTLEEQVQDAFYLTDVDGNMLDASHQQQTREALMQILSP
jgi:[protein-PII] uridylyltransferase